MNIFTTKKVVRRHSGRDEFGGYQVLQKVWMLFGWPVWVREVDREQVPAWAEMQQATLGSTEWRSKFAEYIK